MSVNWLTYDLLLLQRWRVVREAKTMTLLINTFTEKVFPTYLKNEFRIQHICRRNKNNLLRKLYIFQFFTCFKPHHKIMIHGTTLCIKDIEGTSNLFYIPFRTDHNAGLNISTGHRSKNWVTSDESCFTTGTNVRCEVKFFYIYKLLTSYKEAIRWHRHFLLWFSFLWTLQ